MKRKKLTGWHKKEYIGVSTTTTVSPKIPRKLFNGILDKAYNLYNNPQNIESTPLEDRFVLFDIFKSPSLGLDISGYENQLINTITANPKLLIVFIYSIMAIGKNLFL